MRRIKLYLNQTSLNKIIEPHWDLFGVKYDIIDFELGTKIIYSIWVYKGMSKLQRALISFFLDCNIDAGYEEVQIPHLVNENLHMEQGNCLIKKVKCMKLQAKILFDPYC